MWCPLQCLLVLFLGHSFTGSLRRTQFLSSAGKLVLNIQVPVGWTGVFHWRLNGWNRDRESHRQSTDMRQSKETFLPRVSHSAPAMASREELPRGSAAGYWQGIPLVSLKSLCAPCTPPFVHNKGAKPPAVRAEISAPPASPR